MVLTNGKMVLWGFIPICGLVCIPNKEAYIKFLGQFIELIRTSQEHMHVYTFLSLQFSPVLTPHEREYVHHVIVYLCSSPLTPEEANVTAQCDDLPRSVGICRRQQIIAAWAVGGEVN